MRARTRVRLVIGYGLVVYAYWEPRHLEGVKVQKRALDLLHVEILYFL